MSKGTVNSVMIIGNAGDDPEKKITLAGLSITNVSIATCESWKDLNSGEKKEKTEWHRVTFFGKLAELASEYIRKGSKVYVTGRMQTDRVPDTSGGKDRFYTKIVASSFQILLSKRNENSDMSENDSYNEDSDIPF